MSKPDLVILSGPPAAGKSTIARPLANALGMPLLGMDEIKECLADAIGPEAREIADLLGNASIHQLQCTSHELLDHGINILIEGFFQSDVFSTSFAGLVAKSNAVLVHVQADDAVLKSRYEARAFAGERHWIHGDLANVPHMTDELPHHLARRLELDCPMILIDTTYGPVDVAELALMVQETLHPEEHLGELGDE